MIQEQGLRLGRQGRSRLGPARLLDEDPRLGRALHRHVEPRAQRGRGRRRQRADAEALRLHVEITLDRRIGVHLATDVVLEALVDGGEVPETLAKGDIRRSPVAEQLGEAVELRLVDALVSEDQVVHEQPRLGVEGVAGRVIGEVS